MHNWMRAEPIELTLERLARCGYDGIEISAEPAEYDVGDLRALLDRHGVECWGGVTRMFADRDLAHADPEVRRSTVEYVKDSLRFVRDLGGSILTVVPAAVGRVEWLGSPSEEWAWCVASLRECQEAAAEAGVRIAIEPLNRYETHFVNRAEQALALAEEVGGDCGVCLDIFHMNIEEADWAAAIRAAGSRIADFHVADNNRRAPGDGALDWDAIVRELRSVGYDACLTAEFLMPAELSWDDAVQRSADFLRARL
jgi:sugar phosphate isomerase/epimerase